MTFAAVLFILCVLMLFFLLRERNLSHILHPEISINRQEVSPGDDITFSLNARVMKSFKTDEISGCIKCRQITSPTGTILDVLDTPFLLIGQTLAVMKFDAGENLMVVPGDESLFRGTLPIPVEIDENLTGNAPSVRWFLVFHIRKKGYFPAVVFREIIVLPHTGEMQIPGRKTPALISNNNLSEDNSVNQSKKNDETDTFNYLELEKGK